MAPHEHAVRRLRREIGVALVLKQALLFLTGWAFLWGTAIVIVRYAAGTSSHHLLWGATACPLLVALAAAWSLRRLPDASAVRALLDRAGDCGGLLMASAETDVGRWQEDLGPDPGLRVRWHGGRTWLAFAAGTLFVATGLALPQRMLSLGHPLDVAREADRLAAQIQVLQEEAILEPGRADELKDRLGDLKRRASGEDPARTLEALDHLQQTTAQVAQEAAELTAREMEQMGRTEALAEGLRKSAGSLDPTTREEVLEELMDRLKKKSRKPDAADKFLDAKTLKGLHPRTLTRKVLKRLASAPRGERDELDRLLDRLAEEMRAESKELARLLEKLRKAGLIDEAMLKKVRLGGKIDPKELAALLKKHGGKMSVAEMMVVCERGRPGRGGKEKDESKTPLTWKEASSEEGIKFKEEKLPPAALARLKDSIPIGVSKGAPSKGSSGGPATPGALAEARTGGGSAQTKTLLPRHRGAVQRYFERPAAKP